MRMLTESIYTLISISFLLMWRCRSSHLKGVTGIEGDVVRLTFLLFCVMGIGNPIRSSFFKIQRQIESSQGGGDFLFFQAAEGLKLCFLCFTCGFVLWNLDKHQLETSYTNIQQVSRRMALLEKKWFDQNTHSHTHTFVNSGSNAALFQILSISWYTVHNDVLFEESFPVDRQSKYFFSVRWWTEKMFCDSWRCRLT